MSFGNVNDEGSLKITKELKLIYGLDPDKVYITENPDDPIFNSLIFTIANPDDSTSIIFKSNKELATRNLPSGIAESEAEDDLSYFLIEFTLGEGPKDLTSINEADNITCSPEPDNNSWETEKYIDKEKGKCQWTLYPKMETKLGPEESISFIFGNIKSTAKPGMTYISIRNSNMDGYDDTNKLAIYKKYAELDVVSFQAVPGTVGKGRNSTLSWRVLGADSCMLDPGNIPVKPVDQMTVAPDETMNFTLIARDKEGRVKSSTAALYVIKPIIKSFTANTSGPINLGDQVTLSWSTSFASSCKIEPEVGEVKDLDSGQVIVKPVNTTTYTLTCQGFNGPVSQSVKVAVNPVEIKSFTIIPTVTNPGDEAVLNWEVKNATGASIDQQIGDVDIKGSKGSKKVNPMRDISYTLTCNGPNGPVHSTVNLQVNCVKIIELSTVCSREIDFEPLGRNLIDIYCFIVIIKWSTERATSVKIINVESNEIYSTDLCGSYKIERRFRFLNESVPNQISGTLRLICEGPGGPISQDTIYCVLKE